VARTPAFSGGPGAAVALVASLGQIEGVLAAHIGLADAAVTGVPTEERSLRGKTVEVVFEGVVLVETLGPAELERSMSAIDATIRSSPMGLAPEATGLYDLSLIVEKQPG
jgi:hypothetical protein